MIVMIEMRTPAFCKMPGVAGVSSCSSGLQRSEISGPLMAATWRLASASAILCPCVQ